MAEGARRQPEIGVPVLPGGVAAHGARWARFDRHHRVVRRGDGIGHLADLLHRVQGRGAGDVARTRCAVRPTGYPGQRAVPRAGEYPTAAGTFCQGPRTRGAAAGARADRPVRRSRRNRRCRSIFGQRRRIVHYRGNVFGRRRYQRRLHHPAVAPGHPAAGGCATTIGRNPYLGAAPLMWFPAGLANGIPGMPAATAGGALSGASPNIGARGLVTGAIAFQLGGTASAPSAVPRPRAADTAPPTPPSSPTPAAGPPRAPPSPSTAAPASPAALAAEFAASPAPPRLWRPTRSVMVPNQLPGM